MNDVETLLAEAANKAVGHHADCSCCKRIAAVQVVALREWLLAAKTVEAVQDAAWESPSTAGPIERALAAVADLMAGGPMRESPCPKHRALGVNPGCPDCDHADLMAGGPEDWSDHPDTVFGNPNEHGSH